MHLYRTVSFEDDLADLLARIAADHHQIDHAAQCLLEARAMPLSAFRAASIAYWMRQLEHLGVNQQTHTLEIAA